jgi:hypothetical protein
MGVRRRLGHAAAVGGRPAVETLAYSDDVALVLVELQPPTRREVFALIRRTIERAPSDPPAAKPPKRDERVKIKWTEPFTSRFLAEAPLAADDIELARRLGLPSYCRGAMRAARSRFGRAGLFAAPRKRTPRDASLSPTVLCRPGWALRSGFSAICDRRLSRGRALMQRWQHEH